MSAMKLDWIKRELRPALDRLERDLEAGLNRLLASARGLPGLRRLIPDRLQVKLRAKLVIPYVFLTLLFAMLGAFIVTQLAVSSWRERFVNQLLEASRVVNDSFVRLERDHLEDLRQMAFTEGVPQAFAEKDVEKLKTLLTPNAVNRSTPAVVAIDRQGQGLFSLVRDPQTGQYISQSGMDFSSQPLVQNILGGQQDTEGDKFAGWLETVSGPFLFTSAPVRDSGEQLVGVLMVGTPLENFLAEIRAILQSENREEALAQIVVLDQSGALKGTTLPAPEEARAAVQLDPAVVAQLAQSASTTTPLKVYGRDYEAVDAALVIRSQPVGVLRVLLPSDYYFAPATTNRNVFTWLFVLSTMGVLFVGLYLAHRIIAPIQRLRTVSQAVASGDLDQQTGLKLGDEIGELASAFDVMTLRLRERTAEAARLHAETNRLYREAVQRGEELTRTNAQLRATQQQLVQSEKLAAVGQLTAGIAHDVKNPLANIMGLADLMEEDEHLDELTRQNMGIIRENARRANRIIQDLMKFARQSKLEMQVGDLRTTIETVLRLTSYVARKAKVDVIPDLPAQGVMATFDSQLIEQVLVNLVQNAIQAMPKGGALRVNAVSVADTVAIAVQDTGVGIPPENLHRIFDPFFTTKPAGEGTGLGLSVSYGIVANHGGRIEVESVVGQGTTFTVLLPVQPRVAASTPGPRGMK